MSATSSGSSAGAGHPTATTGGGAAGAPHAHAGAGPAVYRIPSLDLLASSALASAAPSVVQIPTPLPPAGGAALPSAGLRSAPGSALGLASSLGSGSLSIMGGGGAGGLGAFPVTSLAASISAAPISGICAFPVTSLAASLASGGSQVKIPAAALSVGPSSATVSPGSVGNGSGAPLLLCDAPGAGSTIATSQPQAAAGEAQSAIGPSAFAQAAAPAQAPAPAAVSAIGGFGTLRRQVTMGELIVPAVAATAVPAATAATGAFGSSGPGSA